MDCRHDHCGLARCLALPLCSCQWSYSSSCKTERGSVVFWQNESPAEETSVHTERSVRKFAGTKVGSWNRLPATHQSCYWVTRGVGSGCELLIFKKSDHISQQWRPLLIQHQSPLGLYVCGDSRLQLSVLVVALRLPLKLLWPWFSYHSMNFKGPNFMLQVLYRRSLTRIVHHFGVSLKQEKSIVCCFFVAALLRERVLKCLFVVEISLLRCQKGQCFLQHPLPGVGPSLSNRPGYFICGRPDISFNGK